MNKIATSRRFAGATLREILNYYPISEANAFKASGVHISTWRRWKAGTAHPHPAIVELIKIKARGDLTDPAFSGFYTTNGVLVDDCGRCYTAGDIRALEYYKKLAFQYIDVQKSHDIIPKRRELTVTAEPLEQQSLKGITHEI